MILVVRPLASEDFIARANNWMERFAIETRRNPGRTMTQFWSHIRREIQADAQNLFLCFHGKCAFCESKMAATSTPHIEHYWPKSRFPERTFDWENWLISCGRCNEKKWAHFPICEDGTPCLLNPTTEDPDQHIDFARYFIVGKTERGEKTIKVIGLDRPPLEDQRAIWLNYINQLLLLTTIPEYRLAARNLLIWAMQPDAPYSAMVRAYLREKTPRLAQPLRPHSYISIDDGASEIERFVNVHQAAIEELE